MGNNKCPNKYHSLIKDTLIFGLGSFGSKFILFLMVPLYTNFMTDEEYGTADLVFTIAQLIIPFISVVIFDSVIRFGLSKNERKENVLLVGFLVLGFSIIVGLFTVPILGTYSTIQPWKWYLYVYMILSILNSIEFNYLKVKSMNKSFALLSIIQTGLMASLNVFFLVFQSLGIRGYLLAYIISNISVNILAFFKAKIGTDLLHAHFDINLLKKMVIYSAPLILNNISWWVIHSSDKVMVEIMVSTAALGVYTVAAKIPSFINVVVSVFQQAWGISSVKEIESTNDSRYYSRVFRYYTLFTYFACIVLVSCMKPFMHYYVGFDFQEAWKYVPLLLVSAVFSSVASYYGSLYGALKKSVNNMVTTTLSAITNIVVNWVLIPIVGIWGAVIGTLVAYIVIALIRMFDVGRFIAIEINYYSFLANTVIIVVQAIFVSLDIFGALISVIALCSFVAINIKDIGLMISSGRFK